MLIVMSTIEPTRLMHTIIRKNKRTNAQNMRIPAYNLDRLLSIERHTNASKQVHVQLNTLPVNTRIIFFQTLYKVSLI